jgi:hypothetical protein
MQFGGPYRLAELGHAESPDRCQLPVAEPSVRTDVEVVIADAHRSKASQSEEPAMGWRQSSTGGPNGLLESLCWRPDRRQLNGGNQMGRHHRGTQHGSQRL